MTQPNVSLLSAAQSGLNELLTQSARYGGIARSGWFEGQEGKVFFRVAQRALPTNPLALAPVIDLANIELHEPFRGQGLFSQVLSMTEQTCGLHSRALYVENVFVDHLHAALLRRGYQPRTDQQPLSYFKKASALTPPRRRRLR